MRRMILFIDSRDTLVDERSEYRAAMDPLGPQDTDKGRILMAETRA